MLTFSTSESPEAKAALMAALDFAAEFHDLGKLDDDIQSVLSSGRGGKLNWDHIDAGVAHAISVKEELAAWLIRAHHSPGLASFPDEDVGLGVAYMRGRRQREAEPNFHESQVARTDAYLTQYLTRHRHACARPALSSNLPTQHGLVMRLLLSCLVDSDHTDSAIWDGAQTPRNPPAPDWKAVREAFDQEIRDVESQADGSGKNRMRSLFYQMASHSQFEERIIACEAGVGLGKTTSVARHLLNYADSEGLRHLFVVAPYTNILRQTARTFRRALGPLATEEFLCENHHRAEFSHSSARQYSALWRAPITLTTAVQFFETLASNNPAQLRKLHELPGSLIFLDEAHASLPAKFWPQTWRWLKTLTEEWQCRVVLASGSMIRYWEDPKIIFPVAKLPDLTPAEVMNSNAASEPNRVKIERLQIGALNTAQLCGVLVAKLAEQSGSVLCIMNTVQSAAVVANEIAKTLDGYDGLTSAHQPPLSELRVLHLSTALSPLDRETILLEVEARTKAGRSDWILVATSCVEAGVDLDFQTGYRERCSVASLIQTSGRVNRHGKREGSVLYDFTIVGDNLLTRHPAFKATAQIVETMWTLITQGNRSPAELVTLAMQQEIKAGKGLQDTISKAEESHDYPKVAKEFRLILSDTRTVVVCPKIIERLEGREQLPWQEIMRNSVQLWSDRIKELGMVPVHSGSDLYVWRSPYDPQVLGVMKGILPIVFSNHGRELIIDNLE